ncbi:FAD-dependent 5-carboxymethylaminomethyl-2-thiouridine(34) oxidoreductase MnmC [Shewanella olleyana]|uniref:FAD-dependent 5-carboxymethylaminomethyl-2-thiouridine(34) oxidoreductase MnmC n=1 Tax=Shewanella olleyana TaxID=135626 RepID=UPI00200C05CF|nr:FAD-dependent 5-carboxymethylaminomethyl-2-thiouridine(34) oxidoreductase MnmC [Shewanella olleyana]MCL1065227.1 FAD-dependent 5-carboxymethylaminomethyl-2-thiouridine(34) oxidoreductase MnmC [Shewanella olleyana]
MTKLTTDFPIVTRDCATISTNFPSSYCQTPDYAASIRHYYETVLLDTPNSHKTLCIGQIGLGIGMEIMLLWQLSQRFNQSIHLSVFDAHSLNAEELFQLIENANSEINAPKHPWYTFAQQLKASCIANIAGCQRLSFSQGQFIIDLHFGDMLKTVQGIPFSQQSLINFWHCLPHTTNPEYLDQHLTEKLCWQMGRISQDNAAIYAFSELEHPTKLSNFARLTGFKLTSAQGAKGVKGDLSTSFIDLNQAPDDIALCERNALRQSLLSEYAYCLPNTEIKTDMSGDASHSERDSASASTHINDAPTSSVAVIGGGIAAAHLALSLAEKGKSVTIYCKDEHIADGASGNKQGAIYPLLTPDNNLMSQYFQQAFLYSRRRLQELTDAGHHVGHQFCGVLQTGFDDRSDARLNKIIHGQHWPSEVAYPVKPDEANTLANIQIDKAAFFYPLAGWICPHEFANAAIKQAQTIATSKGNKVIVKLNHQVSALTQLELSKGEEPTKKQPSSFWQLTTSGQGELTKQQFTHQTVVVASGAQLTEFTQTSSLQVTGFRGQVSHIPSKGKLADLNTVICAHGYLTPENQQHHCVGASYVKSPDSLEYCPNEQLENAQKMHHSFPDRDWVNDVDVSDANARVGVRMVTRDHCPMMGLAPNIDAIFEQYNTEPLAEHQLTVASRKFWRHRTAPSYQGLYVLGGLGSRGLSSGPLAAEALASILCEQTSPISYDMFAMLNPNRMWLRKLLKGKSLMV